MRFAGGNNMKTLATLFAISLSVQTMATQQTIPQAGEGALALTTDPKNVDVYINGKLKANNTPVALKLPEGKYQIEIRKAGKQSETLEVLIVDGAVVSQKVTLSDLSPPQLPMSIDQMLHHKRDVFETEKEFQERRQKLLKTFNQGVQQHDSRYQAGVVYLQKNGYDITTGQFPVRIEWQAWAKKEFTLPEKGHFIAVRDDAKLLWEEGEPKPLYVYVELMGKKVKVSKPVLIGLGTEWFIKINSRLPTVLQTNWQQESMEVTAFSPDLNILASATGKIIKLWKVDTGKQLQTLNGHQDRVSSLAFSPDGQTLASGSMDNTIKLWKVSNGELVTTMKGAGLFFNDGHESGVNLVAFSPPNGEFIVSGGVDHTMKVWEFSTGKVLHTLTGHKDAVTAIALTRREDGMLIIASGSQDKLIKLWFERLFWKK